MVRIAPHILVGFGKSKLSEATLRNPNPFKNHNHPHDWQPYSALFRQTGQDPHMNIQNAKVVRTNPLGTPTDLGVDAVRDISGALTTLLADMFALWIKTKNFHWHPTGISATTTYCWMIRRIRSLRQLTRSPSERGRSAARRSDQSAILRGYSECSTTTQIT
jgi:hypothetical protein